MCRLSLAAIGALFALFAVDPGAGQTAELFADDFDAGDSGPSWAVFTQAGDCVADFAFDYSTRGIPPAPNSSGGSTVGLRLMVNANDAIPATDAISVYPSAASFAGDYSLFFDMWANYCGGAGGGTGSTQFATAGVNHSGTRVVWPLNPASDGLWFAVNGEGGAADDYSAYSGPTLMSVTAGGYAASSRNNTAAFYQNFFSAPPFETAGAPGKQWVEVEIRVRGGAVEWRLNGRVIAMRYDPSAVGGKILLGQADTFSSISVPPSDTFVVYDNVRVVARDCNGNGIADAQDLAAGTSVDCNATGLPDECEAIEDGDFDGDGDLDAADIAALGDCLSGPGVAPTPPSPVCCNTCIAVYDLATSGAIDLADVALLQLRGTPGPFAARAAAAVRGARFMAEVVGLTRADREARIQQEILGGNVPGFMRTFVPVTVSATINGMPTTATYYVTPDYLAIGHDDDFVRIPMTPLIAQPIADALGCLLPTRKMVNDIHGQASVKLSPQPISPSYVDIMLVTTQYRHNDIITGQQEGYALGPLVGGIKKDVVITTQIPTHPGKVAIFGWHYTNGTPIQPLYLGHEISYVDYSHGIRLVKNQMLVNGQQMSVAAVLADPALCVLLSDEGIVAQPRY